MLACKCYMSGSGTAAAALPGALERGLGRGPDGPRRVFKDVHGATSLLAPMGRGADPRPKASASSAAALPGALKRGLGRGPDGPRRVFERRAGATSLPATGVEEVGYRPTDLPPFAALI